MKLEMVINCVETKQVSPIPVIKVNTVLKLQL